MQKTILCESAGWVLFSDGRRLVFADRGTSYRRVLMFVLALLALIFGVNGIAWLAIGIGSGEISRLGMILSAVAGLLAFGARWVWGAEKRDQKTVPDDDQWVAVLDLEAQTLVSPEGGVLAPLSSVRFQPVMQFGSSSRALAASWPEGRLVVYRGHPFASSIRPALDALRQHGVVE